MPITMRKAILDDVPALERLIPESVRELQKDDYTPEQIEGALGTVFGVDRQLIRDGTYFVAEEGGAIVGCGGWSKRGTPFGSDDTPVQDNTLLDPTRDAARIRAFFVLPSYARRGIGSRLMEACEAASKSYGFTRLELVATLTGEPLYARHGFDIVERLEIPLRNGALMPVVRMTKSIIASKP